MASLVNDGVRSVFRTSSKMANRAIRVSAFASAIFASMLALTHAATAAADGKLPAGAFALVNGVALPQSQLDTAAQAQALRMDQPVTSGLREATTQRLIVREVLRQAAEKAGYGTHPECSRPHARRPWTPRYGCISGSTFARNP